MSHRGVHRRRIEDRVPLGLVLDRLDQPALLKRRQHDGRLLFGVLVFQLPLGPVLLGTQRDDALDHVQRRGVGRRVGPARLADDHLHLGETSASRASRAFRSSAVSVTDARGTVTGMSRMLPSSSGGM